MLVINACRLPHGTKPQTASALSSAGVVLVRTRLPARFQLQPRLGIRGPPNRRQKRRCRPVSDAVTVWHPQRQPRVVAQLHRVDIHHPSRVRPSIWSFVRIDHTCFGRSGGFDPSAFPYSTSFSSTQGRRSFDSAWLYSSAQLQRARSIATCSPLRRCLAQTF